jgi:hypothetical protein
MYEINGYNKQKHPNADEWLTRTDPASNVMELLLTSWKRSVEQVELVCRGCGRVVLLKMSWVFSDAFAGGQVFTPGNMCRSCTPGLVVRRDFVLPCCALV